MRPLDGPIDVVHVDDEQTFAELAATFLEKEDPRFDVESFRTAEAALDHLDDADPDCLVSDYEMPGRSGVELLEAVRERDPDLPFILFTGKGSEEIASEAISKGVTDYLQKQSGTEQYAVLANRVENAVAQYRTERELAETRERMAFALDATDSVVFEVDLETGENTHHGPFESLYGVPESELSDSAEFDRRCVHPEDRDRINQYMDPESFDELGDRVEFEFRTHPDNGEVRWIRSEAYIDTDEDGSARRLVGIDTDVTERRRRE